MKCLRPGHFVVLLIVFLGLFTAPQIKICHSANSSSTVADNLYSSSVLITQKKLKVPILELLASTAFLSAMSTAQGAPTLPSNFNVSSSDPIGSFRPIKKIGTGFQTNWGVVTASHVMESKAKAVLTTFHKGHYSIKKMNMIKRNDKHIPTLKKRVYQDAKLLQNTTKEVVVYDWGDMHLDMALIYVKIPGVVPVPLAKEVKIGEPVVTLGRHPENRKITYSKRSNIIRIYSRRGIKHIQLSFKSVGGMSGSPVLNMKGEVVGIIRAYMRDSKTSEAVHVEELRNAIGLSSYDVSKNKYSLDKYKIKVQRNSLSSVVFTTSASNIFHMKGCSALNASEGLIKFDTPQEASKAGGLPCNYCNP